MKQLLLLLTIFLPFAIHAQISSGTASNVVKTSYTNGVANDDIFVFCTPPGVGELTAAASGGGVNLNFYWEIYNPTINGFVAYSNELGVSTSAIGGLADGGYKVTIKDAGGTTVDCFRAWVFIDIVTANANPITPTCQTFPLTGTASTIDYNYYNAPSHPFVIDASTVITVCFDADHTFVSDLGFHLVGPPSCGSPDIELAPYAQFAGGLSNTCNEDNHVRNLCFSTTAAATLDVCSAPTPPLTGTYASSDPWNALYGCDATLGGWRVQIWDCTDYDEGDLTRATITFSGTSECGPNPTTVVYDSGAIRSKINDNSCSAATASIYEVPLTNTQILTKINSYTVKWTCSDPSFIIANPNLLNTTATPTEKRDAWFYLSITDNLGQCVKTDSTFYEYEPANPPNIDPIAPICNNDIPTSLTAGGQTGVWRSAGVPDSTIGSFDPLLVTPGYHIIEFEDADICGGITQDSIFIYDLPIISLTQDDTICSGDSTLITFNIIGGGLSPYDVTINNGNGDIVNYNPVAGTFSDWFSPEETDYYFSSAIIDANGCEVNESDSVLIIVNPTPLLNVIGDTTICRGDSALFEFELEGTSFFNIQYNDGSGNQTFTGLDDGDQLYVKPNDSAVYTFNYISDGAFPQCDTNYNLPIYVNVNPLPTATFTGDTIICSGDSANIRLRRTGLLAMNLTYNDGTNDILINNIQSFDTTIIVNPTAPTTYTITLISYNNDVMCEQVVTSSVFVDIHTPPSASLSGQQQICSGDSTNLIINSDGTAPFDILFFDGTTDQNLVIANDGDAILVHPAATTTYILKELRANSVTRCPNLTHDSLTVIVNSPPRAQLKDYICNGTATGYQVVIDLFGGNQNYNVTGPPSGTIVLGDTNRFISDEIPTGDPYTFYIDDNNYCGPIAISGVYACDCISEPGTIDKTPLDVCVDQKAIALPNYDYTTDDNDTIVYVLHEGANQFIVNQVDTNTIPEFLFNPATMQTEKTYYISTVVGDSLVLDPEYVDFGHVCTKVLPGVPVIFHDLPTMTMIGDTTICDGQTADLNFAITGKSPFSIDYTANNVANVFNRNGSGKQQVGPLSDSTLYIAPQITDDNGCTTASTDQVMVNVNPIPTATLSTLDPSYCFGDSAYLVFSSTGNGPWSIDFTDGSNAYNITTNNAIDSVLVKDVVTTTYTLVQVSDNTNPACVGANNSSVTFTVNPIPTAVLSGSTAICFGSSATINIATSGNPSFLITIDDEGAGFVHNTATDGNSFVVTPTDTTNYTITNIADGSNPTCSSTLTSAVTVAVNPTPTLSVITVNDTICAGDSTLFTLYLTSDGPYDVTYSDGTNSTTLTNVDSAYTFYLSPSENTTYTFNDVTDNDVPAPACSVDPNITKNVVVFKRPTVSFGSDLEICEGDTAFLPYSVDGVNPTYNAYYLFDSNFTEQVFTGLDTAGTIPVANLSPGLHTFQLTRANDSSSPTQCFKPQTASIKVQVNPTPRVTISGDTTLCAGETLAIRFNFPTGIPDFDLDLFDGTNTTALNNINNSFVFNTIPTDSVNFSVLNFFDNTAALCAGVWDMDPVTVNVNPIPSVTFTGNDTICIGQTTDLTFRGLGVSDFSYHLDINGASAGALGPVDSVHVEPVTPIITTTYAITQMDDGSTRTCSSFNQGEVTIVVRPLPTAEISSANEVCFGTDVSLNIDVTGYGPFDITYQDQTGTLFQTTYQPQTNIYTHSLPVGSHTFDLVSVTMSEDPSCVADPATLTGLAIFRVDPIPVVEFKILDGQTCSPVDATFINNTDAIFLGNCTWSLGDGRTINSCTDTLTNISYVREGSYDVRLNIVAPLSTKCTSSKLVPDAIIVHPDPVADFGYSPEPATIENNTVKLINRTVNGQTYEWTVYNTNGSVYATSNDVSPYVEFPNEDEGEYDVHLYAISPYGCTDEITKVVTVEGVLLVNIPNSFTPNGDGVNDFFGPVVYGAYTNEDFSFAIYNRWGEEIFFINNYDPQAAMWDGTFEGKKAQEGSYVYRVIAKSLFSDKIEEFYGEFTLLR
jgi:gliding motility-associated-like protein